MPRIAYFGISTQLGGAERSLLELLRSIESSSKGKYNPWVVLPLGEGPLIDELRSSGIPYDILPIPDRFFKLTRSDDLTQSLKTSLLESPSMAGYFAKAFQLFRKHAPALIHTTGIKCHALSVPISIANQTPVLWHFRDILPPDLVQTFFGWVGQLSHVHAIANSKATSESVSGVPVIYNGLNSESYKKPTSQILREEYKVPPEDSLIGIVGVLARWKGQELFLDAARELLTKGIKARFFIIGDEIYDTDTDRGYGDELREKVKTSGFEDQIHITGFRKDVIEVMGGLDLLVHASTKPEPFGRVLVEANALEVPVVASNAGGVREIIQNEKSGLLFEPGNCAALVAAIQRIDRDPHLAKRLTERGRQIFLEKFTSERYVSNIIREYDRLIG